MKLGHPILQFGTSRFLQAHVDLFVSEALESGDALGGITVVQSTDSPTSCDVLQAQLCVSGADERNLGDAQAPNREVALDPDRFPKRFSCA